MTAPLIPPASSSPDAPPPLAARAALPPIAPILALLGCFAVILGIAGAAPHLRRTAPLIANPVVKLTPPDGSQIAVMRKPLTFTAAALAGQGLIYSWTFGDGVTASGAQVSHTYADYGYYVVTLTAHDARGKTTSAQTVMTITPTPPKAVIKATQDRYYSYMLSADGTASTGASLRYYWDFGDGHTSDSGDQRKPQHIYLTPGTYVVALTVIDAVGQKSVATAQIVVKPQ